MACIVSQCNNTTQCNNLNVSDKIINTSARQRKIINQTQVGEKSLRLFRNTYKCTDYHRLSHNKVTGSVHHTFIGCAVNFQRWFHKANTYRAETFEEPHFVAGPWNSSIHNSFLLRVIGPFFYCVYTVCTPWNSICYTKRSINCSIKEVGIVNGNRIIRRKK